MKFIKDNATNKLVKVEGKKSKKKKRNFSFKKCYSFCQLRIKC